MSLLEDLTTLVDAGIEFRDRPFANGLIHRLERGDRLGPQQLQAAELLLEQYDDASPSGGALIVITKERERWVLKTPFRLKDVCKSIFGARWDKGRRAWTYSASPTAAAQIVEAFAGHNIQGDAAWQEALAESARRKGAQVAKRTTDLPPIPKLKTDAWLHQRQAYTFAKELPSSLLAMDMGTGKSLTAVSLIVNNDAKRVLILCPKAVVGVWPREFSLHAEEPWTVLALHPKIGSVAKRMGLARDTFESPMFERVAIVVNYEAARADAFAEWSTSVEWDYVVFDECHRIKDGQGVTSRYCAKLRSQAQRRLGLTGTPLPQGPLDAFGQFKALDPDIFGHSFTKFRARYAIMGGYGNYQIKGYRNEEEFNEKFYSISFRVTAEDVLDLPGEHDVTRYCELSGPARKIYDAVNHEMLAEWVDGSITAANALTRLLRLQQITGGAVHDDEHKITQVDTSKADLLADIVVDLPADEPVIVFCRFVHDLDVVEAMAKKLKRSYGEVSGRRNDMGPDAKLPEGISVMAVQVQSGSEGIDLTRSHVAIFYSLGFSLSQYLQARRRLSRPGQESKVLFLHLVVENTVDESVYRALAARQEVVDFILGELGDGGIEPGQLDL